MYQTQTQALKAFSEACHLIFMVGFRNLPNLIESCQSSARWRDLEPLPFDKVTSAMTFRSDDGDCFFNLGQIENSKINFQILEILSWLANDVLICSQLSEDADHTVANRHLHELLAQRTQSVAIRSVFLKHFSAFCLEHIQSTSAENALLPNQEAASKFFGAYKSDIEQLSGVWIGGDEAAGLLQSMTFPTTPLVMGKNIQPDGCRLNGVWMTTEQKAQFLTYMAELQARGMRKQAG